MLMPKPVLPPDILNNLWDKQKSTCRLPVSSSIQIGSVALEKFGPREFVLLPRVGVPIQEVQG